MSKRNRTGRAAALALAGLVCALAAPGARAQRQQPQPAAAAPGQKAAAIQATTEEVLRETSEIRKLAVLRPVKSGAQSRAEIEQMLLRNLDEQSKPEKLRASELVGKKFGLFPADFRLRAFIVSVLTEQILGYYDPKAQHFYLADWIDVEGQRPVMAHELVHALQDQHFNLRRFEKWPDGDSDAEAAAHALVEGDATLAMSQYVMRDLRRAASMMKSMSGGSSQQLDRAPRVLRESLVFPYEHGLAWVSQVHRRGGWEAVSAAYRELPQSTEQILHAEKYFAREAPVKIDIADLSRSLGEGWRRVDYDVNGEFGYYLFLDEFLKSKPDSQRAAAGWGGDRYALYEHAPSGATFLAHVSAWDTEPDAREFFDAYVRRTTLRYKGAAPSEEVSDGPAHARREWSTAEGPVVVERRGSRVVAVEGVPAKARAAELLKALLP